MFPLVSVRFSAGSRGQTTRGGAFKGIEWTKRNSPGDKVPRVVKKLVPYFRREQCPKLIAFFLRNGFRKQFLAKPETRTNYYFFVFFNTGTRHLVVGGRVKLHSFQLNCTRVKKKKMVRNSLGSKKKGTCWSNCTRFSNRKREVWLNFNNEQTNLQSHEQVYNKFNG